MYQLNIVSALFLVNSSVTLHIGTH